MKLFLYGIKKYKGQYFFFLVFYILLFLLIYLGYYENLYSVSEKEGICSVKYIITILFKYHLDVTIIVIGVSCYMFRGYDLIVKRKKTDFQFCYENGMSVKGIYLFFVLESFLFFMCGYIISIFCYVFISTCLNRSSIGRALIFGLTYGMLFELIIYIKAGKEIHNFLNKKMY